MRYRELFENAALDNGPATVLAIHAMTDLPLFALLVGKRGPKAVVNVMVKSSEDAFIDADGLHPLIEVLDQAAVSPHDPDDWEMQEISPKTLLNWSNSGRLPQITRPMVPRAKDKAREILAELGIAARL